MNDQRDRYALYRLCPCSECSGRGRLPGAELARCLECRGEGRVRQEVADAETPEGLGVAIVTLAREGEWDECPFGLLDRYPEGKTTGTWLILPWGPSPRNVRDAARVMARKRHA